MYNIQTYKQFMKNILNIKEKLNIILKNIKKIKFLVMVLLLKLLLY